MNPVMTPEQTTAYIEALQARAKHINVAINFHPSKELESIIYSDPHWICGREDGPAVTRWSEEGVKLEETYAENKEIHREHGPARIFWDLDGDLIEEKYAYLGKLHRNPQEGPAVRYIEQGAWQDKYYWEGQEVNSGFVPPHLRPKPDSLGRVFI